ncbi:hypothetical protein L873DRAFT_935706 [Choiromyces venosus 120613-1]|uniref:Uncharacterized protein n=1 Tax=Choiromyces venosus 120613-1 TaxID=1336337 RepID=A0A3N4JLW4_9PEZI|nr:hypothetical protein L873DRAFT_935706 [Choiromyces venosus 120613-1]
MSTMSEKEKIPYIPGPWNLPSINSVRYGASGAPKSTAPRPHSLPCPAHRPGAGYFFYHTPPLPQPRPLSNMGGKKRGPV